MTPITTETAALLPTGTWSIDATHSTIGFEIDYLGGAFRGTFAGVDAQIAEDGLTGSARVDGIHVQDENLSGHLLGPDFFDAERHPGLTFASTGLRADGDGIAIDGELTLKGATQPVTLAGTVGEPITDPYGRERISLDLATTIDRTDFGIDWNVPLPSGDPALSNDVRLSAQLFLTKEA